MLKKKHGEDKRISKEDKFQMKMMQPACHTPRFSNEHFLVVMTEFSGCLCCVNLPEARMKMTIVPTINPECFGFVEPQDYYSTELGDFNVHLVRTNELNDHAPEIE